jgi:hypothetical protein
MLLSQIYKWCSRWLFSLKSKMGNGLVKIKELIKFLWSSLSKNLIMLYLFNLFIFGFNTLVIYCGVSPLALHGFWKLVNFGFLVFRAYDLYQTFKLLKQDPKTNFFNFNLQTTIFILIFEHW